MLKVDIANTIHSMLMLFAIHGRLGRNTCNDICQFFHLTFSTMYKLHRWSLKCNNFKGLRSTISNVNSCIGPVNANDTSFSWSTLINITAVCSWWLDLTM